MWMLSWHAIRLRKRTADNNRSAAMTPNICVRIVAVLVLNTAGFLILQFQSPSVLAGLSAMLDLWTQAIETAPAEVQGGSAVLGRVACCDMLTVAVAWLGNVL